jgi:hypothetical protein
VLEAIRGGQTVAVNEDGHLYGDSELVQLIKRAPAAGLGRFGMNLA